MSLYLSLFISPKASPWHPFTWAIWASFLQDSFRTVKLLTWWHRVLVQEFQLIRCIYCLLIPNLRSYPVSLPQSLLVAVSWELKWRGYHSTSWWGNGKFLEEHVEWKKLLPSFENSVCNMKKETWNVACYGDLKYMAMAKTCLLGLAMARGQNKEKTRFQWL